MAEDIEEAEKEEPLPVLYRRYRMAARRLMWALAAGMFIYTTIMPDVHSSQVKAIALAIFIAGWIL